MKDHSSHDILLLCPTCHQRSNITDLQMRQRLAFLADAPFTAKEGGAPTVEQPNLKYIFGLITNCASLIFNNCPDA